MITISNDDESNSSSGDDSDYDSDAAKRRQTGKKKTTSATNSNSSASKPKPVAANKNVFLIMQRNDSFSCVGKKGSLVDNTYDSLLQISLRFTSLPTTDLTTHWETAYRNIFA